MTNALPLSDLDVVGFLGRFPSQDWPVRLLPVYRSRTSATALLPPLEERDEYVRGVPVQALEFDEMLEEGEVTQLGSAWPARSDHVLWLDRDGPRYAPRHEAEQALEAIAREAVQRSLEGDLIKRSARIQLFRSLRARPTAVANALLSVHFQLIEDFSQVKPIREDSAKMAGSEPTKLEEEMIHAFVSSKPSIEVRSAVAAELSRAGRDALKDIVLRSVSASEKWASRPALSLRWDLLGQAA
jgi:hypothetical protein